MNNTENLSQITSIPMRPRNLILEIRTGLVVNRNWQFLPDYVFLFPEKKSPFDSDNSFFWQAKQVLNDWYAYPEGFSGGEHDQYRQEVGNGLVLRIFIDKDGIVNYQRDGNTVFTSSRYADLSSLYRVHVQWGACNDPQIPMWGYDTSKNKGCLWIFRRT